MSDQISVEVTLQPSFEPEVLACRSINLWAVTEATGIELYHDARLRGITYGSLHDWEAAGSPNYTFFVHNNIVYRRMSDGLMMVGRLS